MRRLIMLLVLLPGTAAGQSPFRTGWDVDGPVAGSVGALAVTMFLTDRNLPGLTAAEIDGLSMDEVNAFDRRAIAPYAAAPSDISTGLEFALILSPFALLADQDIRDDVPTVAAMYVEMLALSAVIPQIAKGAVDRPRPFVYTAETAQEKKLEPDARRSFFSQHATFSFASAVFVSSVYGEFFPDSRWTPYVWAGTLGAAGVVSILRVSSGMHFPTDVLIGAAVGSAIGFIIPVLHKSDTDHVRTSAAPTPGGAVVSVRFVL